jgi:phage host-nuclease inhibitor protein Gam
VGLFSFVQQFSTQPHKTFCATIKTFCATIQTFCATIQTFCETIQTFCATFLPQTRITNTVIVQGKQTTANF